LVGQPTNDLTAYNYMLFRDSTGKVGVAADAWVREVRVITSLTARFVVQLDNKQEKEDLEAALAARGFNDVEIEIIENAAG
ncbi:phage DNA polymerase-associated SH3 family protein, partial [Escherichia coli]|uniref:phage DNA polymerase-associated SH3 family protein n=1 Tax=Escherichia coli TaxID=562 RepID=UPI000A237996